MKYNLGHRMLLSCEQEAFDKLAHQVPWPTWHRAGTYTICETCGKQHIDHPYIIPHTGLSLLCDGRVVKL